ncbi:MAG: threonylcarbamoyl-AMP synthase [Holosporaceae bacterium]|jgi:L-threonylcarbamoyladenylate synthase|nr:threonylcarbamoyl-AMP synthase [Holosporaceae bacterium]
MHYGIVPPTTENIQRAAEKLAKGNLVVFPTETVYGLGGNAYDDNAVAQIFSCKNRPEFNPLSVCYGSLKQASADVFIDEKARLLANFFLPGPITLLLKKKPDAKLSWLCSAGLETVGIRVPDHPVAQALLAYLPFPLAAPSANQSGRISPTSAADVVDAMETESLCIIDGGPCKIGIESTILDLTGSSPIIVRLGAIGKDEISAKCSCLFSQNNLENNSNAPTKQLKHYAPRKKIVLNCGTADKSDALLAFGTPFSNECAHVLNLSVNGDLREAAANLFAMIRQLDKTDARHICVMPIPNIGIGISINDRLQKAVDASASS